MKLIVEPTRKEKFKSWILEHDGIICKILIILIIIVLIMIVAFTDVEKIKAAQAAEITELQMNCTEIPGDVIRYSKPIRLFECPDKFIIIDNS